MSNIKEIEKRLENLENFVFNYVKSQTKQNTFDGFEMEGVRKTEAEQDEAIEENISDVSDVRTAIEEVYEMILGDM